ncbi:hypothetical protein [Nocardia sp. NPDC004722]
MLRTSLITAVILLILGLMAPQLAVLLLVALLILGAAVAVHSSSRGRRRGGR